MQLLGGSLQQHTQDHNARQPGAQLSAFAHSAQDEHYARDEQYLYSMEKTIKGRNRIHGTDNLLCANLIHPLLLSP